MRRSAPLLAVALCLAACANAPSVTPSSLSLETLLTVERTTAPAGWSTRDLVYLNDRSGTAQLYRRTGKQLRQLTDYPDRVSAFALSPDGKRLVFLKDQGGDENDQLYLLELDSGAIRALTTAPKAKHTLPAFDPSGTRIAFTSTARNGKDFDLVVATLESGGTGPLPSTPTWPLQGSFSVAALEGDRVLLIEAHSNVNQTLSLLDLKQQKLQPLTPHRGDELLALARFTADKKGVYALTDRGSEQVRLVRIELDEQAAQRVIYEQPYDLQHLVVDPASHADGEHLAVVVNERGVERVRLLSVSGGGQATLVTARPTALLGFTNQARFTLDGKALLVSLEQPTEPSLLYAVDWASAKEQRLGDPPAALAGQRLVPAELLRYKTFDDRDIDYFWYAGVSKQARRPVVVLVHGGPEAQTKVNFSPIVQYLASRGISVAEPNVRGSTGYGKSFAHLDDKERREDSVRDVAELARALARRPDVDPQRLCVWGGSYGGYMVLAQLTLYPELWAAGVDIVGIANFRTFLEQTAPYRRALREAEYGSLATDGELLDKLSPIHRVDRIKAPLFLVHGARDPRVPLGETKQMAEALQKRNQPVELLVYEDEGHGLAKRKNRLDAYPKVMRFVEALLRP